MVFVPGIFFHYLDEDFGSRKGKPGLEMFWGDIVKEESQVMTENCGETRCGFGGVWDFGRSSRFGEEDRLGFDFHQDIPIGWVFRLRIIWLDICAISLASSMGFCSGFCSYFREFSWSALLREVVV